MSGEVPPFDAETKAFMMLDFESQRDMRASLNTLVATETNIYVAIVGATFLALAFIGQVLQREGEPGNVHLVLGVAFGALFAVFLLGCAMYNRVVSSRITVVKYARYMNRVRYYFVTSNRALAQYISSDIYDDMPPFGAVGTTVPLLVPLTANTGMIAILNSTAFAAMIGIGYNMLDFSTEPVFEISQLGISWGLISIVVFFALSIAVHGSYQSFRYYQEEDSWNAHHPKPKKSKPKLTFGIRVWIALERMQPRRHLLVLNRVMRRATGRKPPHNDQQHANDAGLQDPKSRNRLRSPKEPRRRGR